MPPCLKLSDEALSLLTQVSLEDMEPPLVEQVNELCDRISKCVLCSFNFILDGEELDAAKFMQCFHSLCRTCVQVWPNNEPKKCPECGLISFKENLTDAKIIREYLMYEQDQVCVMHPNTKAVRWCQECRDLICQKCVEAHKALNATQHHVMKPIEESEATTNALYRCETHPQEPLQIYCHECCKLKCRDCQYNDKKNKSHKISFVGEIVEDVKKEIFGSGKLVRFSLRKSKSTQALHTVLQNRIVEQKHKVKSKIVEDANFLINQIEKQKRKAIEDLERKCKIKESELNQIRLKHHEHGKLLEHCSQFINVLLSHNSDISVFYLKKNLKSWLQKVLHRKMAPSCPNLNFKIKYESKVNEIEKRIGDLGSITLDEIETEEPEDLCRRSSSSAPLSPPTSIETGNEASDNEGEDTEVMVVDEDDVATESGNESGNESDESEVMVVEDEGATEPIFVNLLSPEPEDKIDVVDIANESEDLPPSTPEVEKGDSVGPSSVGGQELPLLSAREVEEQLRPRISVRNLSALQDPQQKQQEEHLQQQQEEHLQQQQEEHLQQQQQLKHQGQFIQCLLQCHDYCLQKEPTRLATTTSSSSLSSPRIIKRTSSAPRPLIAMKRMRPVPPFSMNNHRMQNPISQSTIAPYPSATQSSNITQNLYSQTLQTPFGPRGVTSSRSSPVLNPNNTPVSSPLLFPTTLLHYRPVQTPQNPEKTVSTFLQYFEPTTSSNQLPTSTPSHPFRATGQISSMSNFPATSPYTPINHQPISQPCSSPQIPYNLEQTRSMTSSSMQATLSRNSPLSNFPATLPINQQFISQPCSSPQTQSMISSSIRVPNRISAETFFPTLPSQIPQPISQSCSSPRISNNVELSMTSSCVPAKSSGFMKMLPSQASILLSSNQATNQTNSQPIAQSCSSPKISNNLEQSMTSSSVPAKSSALVKDSWPSQGSILLPPKLAKSQTSPATSPQNSQPTAKSCSSPQIPIEELIPLSVQEKSSSEPNVPWSLSIFPSKSPPSQSYSVKYDSNKAELASSTPAKEIESSQTDKTPQPSVEKESISPPSNMTEKKQTAEQAASSLSQAGTPPKPSTTLSPPSLKSSSNNESLQTAVTPIKAQPVQNKDSTSPHYLKNTEKQDPLKHRKRKHSSSSNQSERKSQDAKSSKTKKSHQSSRETNRTHSKKAKEDPKSNPEKKSKTQNKKTPKEDKKKEKKSKEEESKNASINEKILTLKCDLCLCKKSNLKCSTCDRAYHDKCLKFGFPGIRFSSPNLNGCILCERIEQLRVVDSNMGDLSRKVCIRVLLEILVNPKCRSFFSKLDHEGKPYVKGIKKKFLKYEFKQGILEFVTDLKNLFKECNRSEVEKNGSKSKEIYSICTSTLKQFLPENCLKIFKIDLK